MQHSKGFTLVELMLTLAVAAILLAVAVPSYRSFVQGNRAASQANAFLRALTFTRSEAVKRAEVVTICQSDDQNTCGSDKDSWQDGWIVFSDSPPHGTLNSSTDTLLQAGDGLSGGSTLKAGTDFISYAASGARVDSTNTITFTLTPADSQADMQRLICVTSSGLATIQTTPCP